MGNSQLREQREQERLDRRRREELEQIEKRKEQQKQQEQQRLQQIMNRKKLCSELAFPSHISAYADHLPKEFLKKFDVEYALLPSVQYKSQQIEYEHTSDGSVSAHYFISNPPFTLDISYTTKKDAVYQLLKKGNFDFRELCYKPAIDKYLVEIPQIKEETFLYDRNLRITFETAMNFRNKLIQAIEEYRVKKTVETTITPIIQYSMASYDLIKTFLEQYGDKIDNEDLKQKMEQLTPPTQ